MRVSTGDFLLSCKTIDFGEVALSKKERAFYERLNNELLSLCRSMPESAQTDSMLFLMRYSGIRPGDALDFFASYYPPIWSILYWLCHRYSLLARPLTRSDVADAVSAQSMAMFLHSLDDHLIDGQVSTSPLTLLLRSQAWTMMNRSFTSLAEGIPEGAKTVNGFIDDYYSSFHTSEEAKSLDGYCALFRRQMGILMVSPVLLSMKMKGTCDFTNDIEIAFGSFGIAWRLLDDIMDIEDDMEKGSHSSIYLCLPEKVRTVWNNDAGRGRSANTGSKNIVLNHVLEHGIIEKIKKRICAELDGAASIVEAYKLKGLAREFRCLAYPLANSKKTVEEDNGRMGIPLAKK